MTDVAASAGHADVDGAAASTPLAARLEAVQRHLAEPVDGASVAVFRAFFGATMVLALVRSLMLGWPSSWYLEPAFHFKYWGFGWLSVPPSPVLHGLFLLAALAAGAMTLGWQTRLAAAVFLVAFGVIELLDVTYYLNHYYLVSLVAALLVALPTGGPVGQVLAGGDGATVPRLVLWLLRFQIAVVYFHAGLAKAGTDWLVHGQPLGIWLTARVDLPVVGPWLTTPGLARAMSWAGFLFDTTIVAFLLTPRLRAVAYLVVVGFHGATGALFDIGVFPLLMTGGALIFFEPGWPRQWVSGGGRAPSLTTGASLRRCSWPALAIVGAFVLFQSLFPLRHLVYPGNVLWTEEGMRFAWKVMLRAKSGSVVYRVRYRGLDGERHVSPRKYLTAYQEREMSGQPDLIVQLAHHIARDLQARGHRDVEVRADTAVSLNGRQPRAIVDPTVDLAQVPLSWAPASWILPAPAEAPPRLRPVLP